MTRQERKTAADDINRRVERIRVLLDGLHQAVASARFADPAGGDGDENREQEANQATADLIALWEWAAAQIQDATTPESTRTTAFADITGVFRRGRRGTPGY